MVTAQREAAVYDFPTEVQIQELGSIRAVVRHYHGFSKDSYLNEHSVKALVYEEFPKYERLYDIATRGMIIDLPSRHIAGISFMYVDDTISASHRDDAARITSSDRRGQNPEDFQ